MATDGDIKDMFGSDSESEEETFKGSSSNPSAVNESASGLFGSDSESDADEQPKKLKKATPAPKKKSASKPPKPAQRKPQRSAADDDDEDSLKPPPRGKGDEYDSGEEVVRTKDDEAFIDDEDDLGGVLDEYNQEKQRFHDERPDEDDDDDDEGERYSRGGGGREDDYFEETLKSMKSGRGRSKMKLSPQEIESLVQEVLYKMDKAYTDDQISIEAKVPAFEKLKLVDKLAILLRKVQLQLPMLDFNLLEIIKKWIHPKENGELPNLGLRTKILDIVQRLPIDKEHLKRSGFGKVIMILWKHPDESPENKEVCRQLIDRWSRNVFSKTLDFSKLGELEAEKREANGGALSRPDRRLPSRGMEAVRNKGFLNKAAPTETSGGSERVRMPEQIRIDFTMRPQPKVDATQIPSTKLDPESKKARLMKRMQVIARPTKRAKRAVKMSIEGRGLQS
ncbi:hypothetical protein H310_00096 [Aphanomyces invadans]|uniref:TFIIS N-terminal domain-containing protein n=1 Tax=Aphanomyces invadans TaxID=157072 RepID=A0A024UUE7_9STRA|nr:hypothetical protein H310_00096 [Aphanomyces invadans]ETW09542.1 hypothetical protein H310_00096 [Aphanomyces invadans]|eukprot:XP_008860953.1 hypothetical protein H310_00096 [Aphanomyces invadans]